MARGLFEQWGGIPEGEIPPKPVVETPPPLKKRHKQGKIIIRKSHGGDFIFSCISPNGKILAAAHGYNKSQGAQKGIVALEKLFKEGFVLVKDYDHG